MGWIIFALWRSAKVVMDFVIDETSKITSYVTTICRAEMCPGGVEIFQVTVSMNLWKLDTWDGEEARVWMDGSIAWSQVLWEGFGSEQCGRQKGPDELVVPAAATTRTSI